MELYRKAIQIAEVGLLMLTTQACQPIKDTRQTICQEEPGLSTVKLSQELPGDPFSRFFLFNGLVNEVVEDLPEREGMINAPGVREISRDEDFTVPVTTTLISEKIPCIVFDSTGVRVYVEPLEVPPSFIKEGD